MLTGQGLIGKLIEVVATKLVGRKIELSLDDRRRVCRAFTELYFCVERLEEITTLFLTEIDLATLDGNAFVIASEFYNQSHSIESVSQRFFEIGSELEWAIELYDPALAETVDQLYRFKYSFLFFISNSVEIREKDGVRNKAISYKEPSTRILRIDMDSYYDWVQQNRYKKIDRETVEWPVRMLRFSEFEEEFPDVVFDIEDIEAAKHFLEVLKAHAVVLSEAREKLRKFLIANFKIEEILYVSKGLTRDRL